MMRIAVCDDDISILNQVKEMAGQIREITHCDGYSELSKFLMALESGEIYQAVLMDIEWNGKADGMEVAEKLQELNPDADQKRLLIKYKSSMLSLRFDEILYMESVGHMIAIHTRKGKHSCYGRLEN